jgi:hypothetical protein
VFRARVSELKIAGNFFLAKCSLEQYSLRVMKNVVVPAGPAKEFSDKVLLGNVDPQTRWGLGSLCAGVLASSVLPLFLTLRYVNSGQWRLDAFESASGSNVNANLGAAALSSHIGSLIITRGEGVSKSRPVVVDYPEVVVAPAAVSIGGNPADLDDAKDSLLASLVANVSVPSFSFLGIMNRLESYLETISDWTLVVDQESEIIRLYDGSAPFPGSSENVFNEDKVASFLLSYDAPGDVVPGFGWE